MPELIRDPQWGPSDGARVLIEATEWSARQTMAQILQAAGHRTVACPGPQGSDQRCRLAAGHGCEAAEQADVVVHALSRDDHRDKEVLAALRQRVPDTPVVVELPEVVIRSCAEEYEGCILVPAPMTAQALVAAVEEAHRLRHAG